MPVTQKLSTKPSSASGTPSPRPGGTPFSVIVLEDSDDEDMPLQQMWQRRDALDFKREEEGEEGDTEGSDAALARRLQEEEDSALASRLQEEENDTASSHKPETVERIPGLPGAAAANPVVKQEGSPWGCTPAAPPRPMDPATGPKAAPSPAERLREPTATAAEQRKYPKEEEEEAVICLD